MNWILLDTPICTFTIVAKFMKTFLQSAVRISIKHFVDFSITALKEVNEKGLNLSPLKKRIPPHYQMTPKNPLF